MEVLLLLSKGTSLTTIAERLHLSVKIHQHLSHPHPSTRWGSVRTPR